MNDKSTIKRSFLVFSSGTFISRISGLIRDVVTSALFKPELTDIFFVAFRVPNLFRRVLAESAITLSVVPVLSDFKNDKIMLKKIINSIFTAFIIILVFVCVLGEIFTPEILKIIVPDYFLDPVKASLTVKMARIMFPYIALIAITSFYMGVLNTVGHFFATSIHPVFLNIGIVFFAYISSVFDPPIKSLAYGCILGGIMQILINIPFLHKFKLIPKLTTKIKKEPVLKVVKLLLPSLISASAIPITIVVNTYFAAKAGVGNISYLYWADRLVELPLGVFAVSISMAVLPIFSSNDLLKLKENFFYSFKLCTAILLPATAGILALSFPIVKVLFQRGSFTAESSIITASALSVLIFTLFPSGLIRISVSLFYSVKNSIFPALCSVFSLIIDFIICYYTVSYFKLNGIALAITLSSVFNSIVLIVYFSFKYEKIKLPPFSFMFRIILVSLFTFLGACIPASFRIWTSQSLFIYDFLYLLLCISSGTLMFILASYFLNVYKELHKN